jgi:DNA primase
VSEETEHIKERLNVADVVGEYVNLKQAGQSFKGLCPFHNEKTPSFIVSPHRGTWYCFGACGEGGDIFSFIQKIEGIDFPAALKMLAQRAGVELKGRDVQTSSRRQRLFDLLAAASAMYHEILMRQGAGQKAKAYLAKRGVEEKSMELFQLGYAPDSWDILQRWLQQKGYTDEEMMAAGLVGRSARGRLYSRFRGRIMFPITDTQGRVVAFGGRITPWHETGNE